MRSTIRNQILVHFKMPAALIGCCTDSTRGNAVRAGDYAVLFKDDVGEGILHELELEARSHEAARG
jgi:hypothetical protein